MINPEDIPSAFRYNINLGKFGYCHGSWISIENYVGKVKINGVEQLYFCEPKPIASASTKSLSSPPMKEAWIDINTRSPICIRENGSTYNYKILPPPTVLQIPEEAQKALIEEAKQLKIFRTPIKHNS